MENAKALCALVVLLLGGISTATAAESPLVAHVPLPSVLVDSHPFSLPTPVSANGNWTLTLPKFDDQGGTRLLTGVTLDLTITCIEGSRNTFAIGPFDGTLDELTFECDVTAYVFAQAPLPADPWAPAAPNPDFDLGPESMGASLLNSPFTVGQLLSADLAGKTVGFQQVFTAPADLAQFVGSGGDVEILLGGDAATSVNSLVSGTSANSYTDPLVSYSVAGQITYEHAPEPAGLALLAFGGLTVLRKRRRS